MHVQLQQIHAGVGAGGAAGACAGLLLVEFAGLVSQEHGHAAASPEVVARDGHHGPSRLGATAGAQETHNWGLQERKDKLSGCGCL